MPISIRRPGSELSVAGYRFPQTQDKHVVEDCPWLREPGSNTQLCNVCSQLNFAWLFRESLAGYTVSDDATTSSLSDGIYLGLYVDVSRRTCVFCQLLVYAIEEGADVNMMNEYDDWPCQKIWLRNHSLSASGRVVNFQDREIEHVVRLDVRLKADTEDNVMFSSWGPGARTVTIQKIRPDLVNAAVQLYEGRAVDQDTATLVQTIRKWIYPCSDDCESAAKALSRPESTSIRLIDTMNLCIVGPVRDKRYVTLSYTWGKIDPLVLLQHNEKELRKHGSLHPQRSRLPVTIQDCIRLCNMLGERYLWVDSLCIMQDTTDKHDQIQQMDKIYQEAVLCIVAAAGRDANAGLPGLSGKRDVRQRIIEIDGMRLANTVSDLTSSMGGTFWRSRGWCFQENMLSPRKLIFTPDQTYYHCPHGQCSEDTHCFNHNNLPTGDQSSLGLQTENISNWSVYRSTVTEYSSCELTFESDMLNAFAGISSFLSKSMFLGSPFVMGIPLCSLGVGLLWQPATRLRRRSGTNLPSWSWAGWVGMINYAENQDIFERTINCMQWDIEETFDCKVSAPSSEQSMVSGDWKRHVVENLNDVYYTRTDLSPSQWFSHPIVDQQWPLQSRPTPKLKCTADVAKLNITGEHAELWYQSCMEEGHVICHLQIFDQAGNRAGVAVMDGETFEKTSFLQNSFSCIKVSQTTLKDQDDPAWDETSKTFAGRPGELAINPCDQLDRGDEEFDQEVYDRNICWCMYNVLVVEFEGDVARRVAIGRVHISAFDGADPERRTFWLN